MARSIRFVPLAVCLTVAAVLIGGDTPTKPKVGPGARAVQTVEIKIKDNKFDPDELQISKGDSVKWTNNDTENHTATSPPDDPKFDTGEIAPGSSVTLTFDKAYSWNYHCKHCSAAGRLAVKESP
jgi:plastocyanin